MLKYFKISLNLVPVIKTIFGSVCYFCHIFLIWKYKLFKHAYFFNISLYVKIKSVIWEFFWLKVHSKYLINYVKIKYLFLARTFLLLGVVSVIVPLFLRNQSRLFQKEIKFLTLAIFTLNWLCFSVCNQYLFVYNIEGTLCTFVELCGF